MPTDSDTKNPIFVLPEDSNNFFQNTIIAQIFVTEDFIMEKCTPPARKLFSLTEEDINSNLNDLKDRIGHVSIIEDVQEVISTTAILEKEIQTLDGRWFLVNILPYIVCEDNRTAGVIMTFTDITNRIETLKELEKLNADHDTLMFALSHDIRQPLSTITLLAGGLTEAYKKQNTEQFDAWIEMLKRTTKSLKDMVDGFTPHPEHINDESLSDELIKIKNIAQNVVLSLRNQIHNQNIQINFDFQVKEILFSKNNLRSILYNLVNNAIKFRKPDETLDILISTKESGKFTILSVEDNGPGIAKDHQQAIFNKFSRLDTQIEGTGMGLYIIKRMIENRGGRIEIESELGKGSCFDVYFKTEKTQKH